MKPYFGFEVRKMFAVVWQDGLMYLYVEKYKTGWYFDRKNKRMLNY